ncbi:MAG: polysaccharide deacetylase family protein [Planctomycetaceae bacterium]|nr:polysaccharide deacetylase family protein [Planctomycetaceae bacterium]
MSIKRIVKKTIIKSGLLRFKQCFMPQTAVILYFHSVSNDREGQRSYIGPGITATAGTFRQYMHLLKERFHPVTLDEIADWVSGNKRIPSRSVAITFDDGFADNYHLAAPIMEEFGIRGTFYLTAGCVENQTLPWFCKTLYLFEQAKNKGIVLRDPWAKRDWQLDSPREHQEAFMFHNEQCAAFSWKQQNERIEWLENHFSFRYNDAIAPRMMTWEMARELIQRGHNIGNHTYSHPNVGYISTEDRQIEIVESHRLLAEKLKQTPKHFSYPHPYLNPQHNPESDKQVLVLGYETIVLTEWGGVKRETPPFHLPRVSIGEMSIDAFLWKLETAFAGIKT